jgi:asparagine synthase (glutamine-hydrolysing)
VGAILGIYSTSSRPVDRLDLTRMVSRLAHRGPDRLGSWFGGVVGLGHRTLCTTPESLCENAPFVDAHGRLVVVADARVDNRDELIEALGLERSTSRAIGDSELILCAYRKWHERCAEFILGDFSFAIWDLEKRILFCARDPIGVKPFYYYYGRNDLFVFASEIKGILALPSVPRQINRFRVAQYLLSDLEDQRATFYEDVWRLPPGHCITVGLHGVTLQTYWKLEASTETPLRSDEEFAEAFRELFTASVRCRTHSSFGIGSMLSGGLDSSTIVCVARDLLAKQGSAPLATFSAVFDGVPECDETYFIRSVLRTGKLNPHFVRGDTLSPLGDAERVFWHEDEPFFAPNLFLHWGLYSAARREGVRVLLDGFDGDTVVSHGLAFLGDLARGWRWMSLVREAVKFSRNSECSAWDAVRYHAIRPFVPEPIKQAWRVLSQQRHSGRPGLDILNEHFSRRLDLESSRITVRNKTTAQTSRDSHYRGLTSGLIPFVLEVADRAAAAFSVEPRYPFFDRRLIEFCYGLPPEQKLSQGWSRVIMRRAFKDLLPAEICWRGAKSDLGPNFSRSLLTFEKDKIQNAIVPKDTSLQEYVNMRTLREAAQRFVSTGSESDAMIVWKALTLDLWLKRL